MNKSKQEKRREQKKLSMRRAREKLRKDPIALEAVRKKDRESKKMKSVKISEITSERKKRTIRKQWRERARKYREKKKELSQAMQFTPPNTPPLSPVPTDHLHDQHRSMTSTPSRKKAGESTRRKNRCDLKNKIKELEEKVLRLQRSEEKYKKRCQRKKKSNIKNDTPTKNVDKILIRSCPKEVRRQLLFGEAFKSQLRKNFAGEKSSSIKKCWYTLLTGKIVQKYRLMTRKKKKGCCKKCSGRTTQENGVRFSPA